MTPYWTPHSHEPIADHTHCGICGERLDEGSLKLTIANGDSEQLSHADLMAKRDGAVRLWRITDKSFKLVKDGESFARIDACTDGTFVTTLRGERNEVVSWEAAKAWFTMQTMAAALSSEVWI